MIDLEKETVSLSVAAKWVSDRMGEDRQPTTLWRWSEKGYTLPDGSRVRLETIRDGRDVKTSIEALKRFIAALTRGGWKRSAVKPRFRARPDRKRMRHE